MQREISRDQILKSVKNLECAKLNVKRPLTTDKIEQ